MEKLKVTQLKQYAENYVKQFNANYKKSIHGKNKTSLLAFLQEMEVKYGKLHYDIHPLSDKIPKLKSEIIELLRKYDDFNEQDEKKTKKELIELLQKKRQIQNAHNQKHDDDEQCTSPFHIQDILTPQEIELKDAIVQCFSDEIGPDETFQKLPPSSSFIP
jgi:hypothetical protein